MGFAFCFNELWVRFSDYMFTTARNILCSLFSPIMAHDISFFVFVLLKKKKKVSYWHRYSLAFRTEKEKRGGRGERCCNCL